MLIYDAFKTWSEEIRPAIVAQYGESDRPALAESWNDYTDSLSKDGELNNLQYTYCPAQDDPMPLDLGDELELILDGLGLTIESVFVPFSQSRNKAEKSPSLSWSVTLKRNGRDVLTTDYSAGCYHCPAKASKAPATYQARDRVRLDRKPYPGTSSIYRAPTDAEKLADYLTDWRAAECESGLAMEHAPLMGEANFKPRRVRSEGDTQTRTVPILPHRLDVIHSLLMDFSVLDWGGFEDWASEFGYDTDSRTAETVYRACLDIALKLRAGIGDDTLEKLRELFADY